MASQLGMGLALARGMTFSRDELELRSRQFAIDALILAKQLADTKELWDVVRQLTRASSSVGANHRAMRRARSFKEFAAKLQIVVEEIDEACYWLEIIRATVGDEPRTAALHREAAELRAIFAKARATTRQKLRQLAN